MTGIVHNLIPQKRLCRKNLNANIDLYCCATELIDELKRIGIVDRTKDIPQLGIIKVNKRLSKTRYDYIMLQLYLHQLIKKNLKNHLRFTYNNQVNSNEFRPDYSYTDADVKPTIGDILQLLSIVYNIGHFYNTFTSSSAVIMLSNIKSDFYEMILNASENKRYKEAAQKLLKDKNYHRLHLLNSILILERCDQSKLSVSIGLEILYSYLNQDELTENCKLKYIFSIYKRVRTLSYITYDLETANTPLTIDLCNEKAMCLIMRELLSSYNNTQSSTQMINSITKLLDDTVYNEKSFALCCYQISKKMANGLLKEFQSNEIDLKNVKNDYYYNTLFLNKDSTLNRSYSQQKDFSEDQILKLTFLIEERNISENLVLELDKIDHVRAGYYDRSNGNQTILVSIKKKCEYNKKLTAAYEILKKVITSLRKVGTLKSTDSRYLLVTKFFLFYLFNENSVMIKQTINSEKCVICTRGRKSRIKEIKELLKSSIGNKDENHEVELLLEQLLIDTKNDTSILIPASIVVYNKGTSINLCEFDGLIIHPMRNKHQIIFLEAKNTTDKPSYGKKCLKDKIKKISLNSTDDIFINNNDAIMKYTIKKRPNT